MNAARWLLTITCLIRLAGEACGAGPCFDWKDHPDGFRGPSLPGAVEDAPAPYADEPDEAMILRHLPKPDGATPFCRVRHEPLQAVVTLLIDRIGPPLPLPGGGAAHPHDQTWRCMIYYRRVTEGIWPILYRCETMHGQHLYVEIKRLHPAARGTDSP